MRLFADLVLVFMATQQIVFGFLVWDDHRASSTHFAVAVALALAAWLKNEWLRTEAERR